MTRRLREFAEIRNGNMILIHCQGRKGDGSEHCCGMIRVPFTPPLQGCEPFKITEADHPGYWTRTGGETLDDFSMTPSVDAGECGHFSVTNGQIVVGG